jgi:hypothetical protein
MKVAPLLEPASPPAVFAADESIRSTFEGPAALNAVTLDSRVGLAIRGSTLGVHAFPVPIAPVLRRFAVTVSATRRNAEIPEDLACQPLFVAEPFELRDGLRR